MRDDPAFTWTVPPAARFGATARVLRYYSLKNYLTARFGQPVAKLSLDAGLTCPNRDGTLSSQGCLFCDPEGSGTGAFARGVGLEEQIRREMGRAGRRADRFISYFQAFTNTYAPPDHLKSIWDLALSPDRVVGLAVGTRPDCLDDEVLDLLAVYAGCYEVWLELGLQSASDATLERLNRGHTVSDFTSAAQRAAERNLKVVGHVIIGLPGEDEADVMETARYIGELGLFGVKIHSLYVSRGTGLARLHGLGSFHCLTREEFVESAVRFLEAVPDTMVVHRLTGDPNPETLLAPPWAADKGRTIDMIRRRMAQLDTWQGKRLGAAPPPGL